MPHRVSSRLTFSTKVPKCRFRSQWKVFTFSELDHCQCLTPDYNYCLAGCWLVNLLQASSTPQCTMNKFKDRAQSGQLLWMNSKIRCKVFNFHNKLSLHWSFIKNLWSFAQSRHNSSKVWGYFFGIKIQKRRGKHKKGVSLQVTIGA